VPLKKFDSKIILNCSANFNSYGKKGFFDQARKVRTIASDVKTPTKNCLSIIQKDIF
jgi:hypothetical protein